MSHYFFFTNDIFLIQLVIYSYWDPCYDMDLMIDRVSLDLLYLQLIEELDLGWIIADQQTKEILSSFEAQKQKREVRYSIQYLIFFILYYNVVSQMLPGRDCF